MISTAVALVIGLPIGLAIGLGRFRGRRALHILANASLALPPVLVGSCVLLLVLPQGAFGSLHIAFTLTAVYVAQTILALPYIVALDAGGDPGPAAPDSSPRRGRSAPAGSSSRCWRCARRRSACSPR